MSFGSQHVEDPEFLISGLGSGIPFGNIDYSIYREIHWIDYATARRGAVTVLRRHGLFAGLSSGAAYAVASWHHRSTDSGVVFISPDPGHRYLSTASPSRLRLRTRTGRCPAARLVLLRTGATLVLDPMAEHRPGVHRTVSGTAQDSAPRLGGMNREEVLLHAGAFLSSVGVLLVAPYLAVYLTRDLGWSNTAAGFVIGLSFCFTRAAALASGWLCRRVPALTVMHSGNALRIVGYLLLLRDDAASTTAALVLTGAGAGLYFPAAKELLLRVVPEERQLRSLAVRNGAANLGRRRSVLSPASRRSTTTRG